MALTAKRNDRMTHEARPGDEQDGPEHDPTLPDADSISGDLSAAESDAEPLDD